MGVLRLVRRFKRESSAILGGPMLREPVGFSTNATCYVIRDAVSDSVCHRLIAEAESRGIAVTGADYPPSYRDNDRLVFDDPKLADWLFDILGTELPRELADDGLEPWQIAAALGVSILFPASAIYEAALARWPDKAQGPEILGAFQSLPPWRKAAAAVEGRTAEAGVLIG